MYYKQEEINYSYIYFTCKDNESVFSVHMFVDSSIITIDIPQDIVCPMLSGNTSAAGPSLLTVTVWTALVMLFRRVYNPRYVRKVSVRIIRDGKIIQIGLNMVLHKLFGLSSSLSAFFLECLLSSKCWLSMLSSGS